MQSLKFLVSSCLMGQKVRYDGADKHCPLVTQSLSEDFELVAHCPEVTAGLSIPRPPIQLQAEGNGVRLIGRDEKSIDPTEDFLKNNGEFFKQWSELSGAILKKKSPSCSISQIDVFDSNNNVVGQASGLFVQLLNENFPFIPLIDEEELVEPDKLGAFVLKAYFYDSYKFMLTEALQPQQVVEWHSSLKYLWMTYSNELYNKTGQLIAQLKGRDLNSVVAQYFKLVNQYVLKRPSHGQHVNTVEHILGHYKQIDNGQKDSVLSTFAEFKNQNIEIKNLFQSMESIKSLSNDDFLSAQVYLSMPSFIFKYCF